MTKEKLDIGPGHLLSLVEPNSPFILSKSEWIDIQKFVYNGLQLPINDVQFNEKIVNIGGTAQTDMSDFQKLIRCYQDINTHCLKWRDEIFDEVVDLANDVVHYGKDAQSMYEGIIELAEQLDENPEDKTILDDLKELLVGISKEATKRKEKAHTVFQLIQSFSNNVKNDQIVLMGPDGNSGLKKYYNDELVEGNEGIEELQDRIANLQQQLDDKEKEHKEQVTIAATTPTYAWFYPLGTWIGIIIGIVYTKLSLETKGEIKAIKEKVSLSNASLKAVFVILNYIKIAGDGISAINEDIVDALLAIEKIEDIWGSIAHDLDTIVGKINTNPSGVQSYVLPLKIHDAMTMWTEVADKADKFRANAYIVVTKKNDPTI